MKVFLYLFTVAVLILPSQLLAQASGDNTNPDNDQDRRRGRNQAAFWEATMNGGNYLVKLDKITAVSRHKYLLDGGLIVDEVTVDTLGKSLVRFYFIEPVTLGSAAEGARQIAERAKQLADQAAARGGLDIQNMVSKKYPITTHAQTIEYRVLTKEVLDALYTSVKNSWQSGRGRAFSEQ